ncbi:hypothetical protein IW492_14210 [Enterococcus sp. BWB1-3]|uniref:hypothetical protein n=1 Tax=Enterococcus sp. BWB1-3 TaxID=2787713 RepID=UPI001922C03B|nr:hypothetical protein [Enterococcus sp. BWB1-3]MBL1230384.1 hypothetical protein [Enterococcus sp. BWB1-3]
MPKIMNSYFKPQIDLELNLIQNSSLIYKKGNAGYLNWFPMDFRLQVEEEEYTFEYIPILSLDSLDLLFNTIRSLLKEKKEKGIISLDEEYQTFECGATEGEFNLKLRNTHDEFGKDIVSIELWLNVAYLKGKSVGYNKGFNFTVFLEDIDKFFREMELQLYNLTDGYEGRIT